MDVDAAMISLLDHVKRVYKSKTTSIFKLKGMQQITGKRNAKIFEMQVF